MGNVVLFYFGLTFIQVFFRYKVYEVVPKSLDEAELIHDFSDDINFDFWSEVRALDTPVDVMVAPSAQYAFEDILNSKNIEYTTLIDDVEK